MQRFSQIVRVCLYRLPVLPVPPSWTLIYQQTEAATANDGKELSHPQPFFGSSSTNQRKLASAPDLVSCPWQPIAKPPAHLAYWGPLAGLDPPTHRCCGSGPIMQTIGQSDGLTHYQTHVAWQSLSVCSLFFFCVCVCNSANPSP